MFLMIGLVAVFVAFLVFWTMRNIEKGKAMGAKFAPPPSAVTTVVVKAQTWQPVLSAVGSLRAVNGVTVSTDLAGIVSEIPFESGTAVKKGDVLVKLDTAQEDAQLRSAEAKLSLAKSELERRRDLIAKKAIAQSDWDTAQSQLTQTEADVSQMRALVARKRITAPFDGMAGIRMVNIGQYLNPGAAIVSLQSVDPIYVEFALPQQSFEAVAVGKKVRLGASGLTGERFEGEITALDSRIDESTRNFIVQATIQNSEGKLRPGMFVDVEVLLPEQEGVLAIPSSSIAYAPYGDSIYVVIDGKQVEQRFVKLGPKRGDQVAISSGLKEGDEIVSSGVFKLRPGAAVQVNNSVQPGNELQPKPVDT
ncbi:MAG: Efflux transporter, family, subunit [Chthoniobacter sp.]|nr:Efflux transporter, family, subunit [Chthoniobacter sp.]